MDERPPIRNRQDLQSASAETIRLHLQWELKRLRTELNLTQIEVATAIGYRGSAGAFSGWATGDNPPPEIKLRALDEAFPGFELLISGETFSSLRDRYARRRRVFVPPPSRYDVFLAAPMAAADAYDEERAAALELVRALKLYCGFTSVYYAGREIEKPQAFESPSLAIRANAEALYSSQFFVLFSLRPLTKPSGIFVEAGMALAKSIPSIYFVPHSGREYLPWMLGNVGTQAPDLPAVSIEQVSSVTEATSRLQVHGPELFRNLSGLSK